MTEKDHHIYKLQDQLVARSLTPEKMLVYWQLHDEKVQFICEYFYIPEDQVIKSLRLMEHGSSIVLHEVILRQGVSSWVFKGIKPNGNYYVELGVKRSSETFLPLLKSNSIIHDSNIRLTAGQPLSPGWIGKVSTYTYYENLEGASTIERHRESKRENYFDALMGISPHIIGGLARHVHALATELGKINQQIHVLTSRPNESREYEQQGNVHIHRVNPINDQDMDFLSWMAGLNLAIIEEALRIANHIEFDLVHTHDWMTGPAAKFLSRKLEIPLIATVHGTEFGRNKGVFTELQQFISKKENELCHCADEIIVCSDFMEAEILSLFKVPNEKISVITNGAVSEKVQQTHFDIEELYPFLKGKKMIYSIGRIVKEKGFQTLIAAADLLKMNAKDICFVVAGNGPLLEWYRQKVRELELNGFVHFIGFVNEDIRNSLMKRADIAVFASSYEPFGLAAAETLAAGVPTVVAKTGGMQTLIEDYKTGFYMQSGDEKNLVRIIEWILENEARSQEIARNAMESINEKFSWSQNAKATDTLYIRALSNNCQKEGIK